MTTPAEIGNRIVTCRTRLRFSQQEVADLVGIAASQLYRYEAGRSKPRPAMADRIAEALGVSTEWLLTGEGDMQRDEKDDTGLRDAPGFHVVPVEFTPRESKALERYANAMGMTPEQVLKAAMYKYFEAKKASEDSEK